MLSYTLWRGQSYVFAVPTSSWILYSKLHYRKGYRTFYQRKRRAVAVFWRSEGLPNVMKFLRSHSRDKLYPTSSWISLILTREPSKTENTHTPGPNTGIRRKQWDTPEVSQSSRIQRYVRLKEQTPPLDWSQGDGNESHFPYLLCGWCKYLKYGVLIIKTGITLPPQKIKACHCGTLHQHRAGHKDTPRKWHSHTRSPETTSQAWRLRTVPNCGLRIRIGWCPAVRKEGSFLLNFLQTAGSHHGAPQTWKNSFVSSSPVRPTDH